MLSTQMERTQMSEVRKHSNKHDVGNGGIVSNAHYASVWTIKQRRTGKLSGRRHRLEQVLHIDYLRTNFLIQCGMIIVSAGTEDIVVRVGIIYVLSWNKCDIVVISLSL